MTVSPFQAFEHLKETLVGYLETAYKISHLDIFSERRSLLETSGVVAQQPYIETTPAYPSGRWLRDVIAAHPDKLPKELVDLMAFGTPIGKNPLCGQAAVGTKFDVSRVHLVFLLYQIYSSRSVRYFSFQLRACCCLSPSRQGCQRNNSYPYCCA